MFIMHQFIHSKLCFCGPRTLLGFCLPLFFQQKRWWLLCCIYCHSLLLSLKCLQYIGGEGPMCLILYLSPKSLNFILFPWIKLPPVTIPFIYTDFQSGGHAFLTSPYLKHSPKCSSWLRKVSVISDSCLFFILHVQPVIVVAVFIISKCHTTSYRLYLRS